MNLKSLLEPLETLIQLQDERIDLLSAKNTVLEEKAEECYAQLDVLLADNQSQEISIQSLTVSLTEAKEVNHTLADQLIMSGGEPDYDEPGYDEDEINAEFQLAAEEDCTDEDECDIVVVRAPRVPIADTVDSVIAGTLLKYDKENPEWLTPSDLLALAKFKEVWNSGKK